MNYNPTPPIMAGFLMDGTMQLYHGDCLEILPTLEAGSVDMVLADPPYGTTACSWDSVIDLTAMWRELKRVIKPNGAIVLFGSQPFTSALVMSNPKWFRYSLVWEKQQSTGFLNARRMFLRSHEDISVFYDALPIFNPQGLRRVSTKSDRKNKAGNGVYGTVSPRPYIQQEGNFPRSVLNIDRITQSQIHPTQKPVPLLAYLIRTYTHKGDTVLDFCMGSGSTLVACIEEERNGIGIEKDAGYFEIARKRIEQEQTKPRTIRMELAPP